MQATALDSIEDVAAGDWNRLLRDDNPFVRHEFLAALERHGCASEATGWRPRHLVARDAAGRVGGAMPLYQKAHSWGEFVFDQGWARAYDQAGLAYYPKLVSAVPFSPVSGQRLISADPEAQHTLLDAAREFARDRGCSSLHMLFPGAGDIEPAASGGLLMRKDCQFHWHNRGHDDLDDFLGTFTAKKRKNVRQERRKVREAGISFEHYHGGELDEATWHEVYELHALTFLRRGQYPYLSLPFFLDIAGSMGGQILVVIARHRKEAVGAAIFLCSETTLYGRYWGCRDHYDSLHFETCYYQGIEYCLANGLARFEPGTQGEHKISRGFEPVATWSGHWMNNGSFQRAIADYLERERRHVDEYMAVVTESLPFRREVLGEPESS